MAKGDTSSPSTSLPRCYQRRLTWPRIIPTISDIIFWEDGEAEEIGSGFFSNVYKFHHHPSGQTVAVKVAKDVSEHIDEEREVMMREIKLLKKLSHPNIIKYFGLCAKDGSFHPVLELVNGGSLDHLLIDQSIPLSWSDKIGFCRDISEGMEYLHSCNIFHRDLKSGNCLLRFNEYGQRMVVVSDFGLAREVNGDNDTLRKLSVVGSPYFMAPEILKFELYNSKVDIFSFGFLLCEIMARVSNDPDDLPRTRDFGLNFCEFEILCPNCPRRLLHLVKDCTEVKDPLRRPSFEDILSTLDKAKSDEDTKQYDVINENVTLDCVFVSTQKECPKNSRHPENCSSSEACNYDSQPQGDRREFTEGRKMANFRFDKIALSPQRKRFVYASNQEDLSPSSGALLQRSISLPNLKKKGSSDVENHDVIFRFENRPRSLYISDEI